MQDHITWGPKHTWGSPRLEGTGGLEPTVTHVCNNIFHYVWFLTTSRNVYIFCAGAEKYAKWVSRQNSIGITPTLTPNLWYKYSKMRVRICTGFPRPSCEQGASVSLIGMTLMTGGEISEEDGLLQACVTHQSAMTSVVRIDHSFSDRSPALWRYGGRHKRLDDDATENVKPHCSFTFSVASSHLRLHGNMSLYRVKGVKCAVVCYFRGRIFYPTNLLSHMVPFIKL